MVRRSAAKAATGADACSLGIALVNAALLSVHSPPGLHSLRLFDERCVGVARAGHPLVAGGPVTVDAFRDHPHLLVSPSRGDAAGPTDEALAAIGRSRRIGLVVPGFSVVGALLERTDLIAVLPERRGEDVAMAVFARRARVRARRRT